MRPPSAPKPYPSDVSDEEWSFVVPYLTLIRLDSEQREHDLRAVFNALRWLVRSGAHWRMMPHDFPPGSGVSADATLAASRLLRGHDLLALHVTPANEQDRAQVEQLAQAVQNLTDQSVTLAYVDQGYTGENAREAARAQGIALEVVKHTEAKRGFILLPRRWVVERSFGWAARFRRLARDYERLAHTLAGYHYLAFACLMLHRIIPLVSGS